MKAVPGQSRDRWIRYIYEFLFGFNLSLTAKLAAQQRPFGAMRFFSSDVIEARIGARISAFLHLHYHSRVAGMIAFVFIAMVIALCMFVLLRTVSRLSFVSAFLLYVSGIVSLIAFPAVFFYQRRYFGVERGAPNLQWYWVALELIVVVVCAELYLFELWRLPKLVSMSVVLAHFVFWSWLVFGGVRFDLAPSTAMFPLAGILSSLAWATYVSRFRRLSKGPA